jgi:hypothetical protein
MNYLIFLAIISVAIAVSVRNILLEQNATGNAGSAKEKAAGIWNRIESGALAPASWFPTWKLAFLFLESMNVTFDYTSDWMPPKRDKLIHRYSILLYSTLFVMYCDSYLNLFDWRECVVKVLLVRLTGNLLKETSILVCSRAVQNTDLSDSHSQKNLRLNKPQTRPLHQVSP